MKNTNLSHLDHEVEQFFNYGGAGDFIGVESNYSGFNSSAYAGGSGTEVLPEADRTLTLQITNTNTGTGTTDAIVFSAFARPTLTQASGITVNFLEPIGGHEQIRQESKTNPFVIKGFKMIVSDADQFSNNITLEWDSPEGAASSFKFQPFRYRSAQNQINTQIDAPDFVTAVDGRTTWTVAVNNGASDVTITMILFLITRGDMGQILKGKNPIELAKGGFPTGLPQVPVVR